MSTDPRTRDDDAHWQAQERGRRAATGRHDAAMDADSRDYLQIAQALQTLPRGAPPAGFAAAVARHAQPRGAAGPERWLLPPLLAALAATVGVAVAGHALPWWHALDRAVGSDGRPWLLACAVCALGTWATRPLLRLRMRRH